MSIRPRLLQELGEKLSFSLELLVAHATTCKEPNREESRVERVSDADS